MDAATVDAVVVGAGLAGLAAAADLCAMGARVQLLEASDRPGGRMATDAIDGFLVDRGFQVLNDAYPQVRARVHLKTLGLRRFHSGAMVRWNGAFHGVQDPLRHPLGLPRTLAAPFAGWRDYARVAWMRRKLARMRPEEVQDLPEVSAGAWLEQQGFTGPMIDAFLRPFLAGILLDRNLESSSRKAAFAMRWFSLGSAALPRGGMGALPAALAAVLPPGVLRLRARVARLSEGGVQLESGERIAAGATVIATDARTAAALVPGLERPRFRSVTHFAFDAPEAPIAGPWLVLNGEGRGPVNDLCVPSELQPTCAPPGRHLVSATVLEGSGAAGAALEAAVREQLTQWFGPKVAAWRTLVQREVKDALVDQRPGSTPKGEPVRSLRPGLWLAGDSLGLGSTETALQSGAAAAKAAFEQIGALAVG